MTATPVINLPTVDKNTPMLNGDWTLEALCAQTDPEVFFPEQSDTNHDYTIAKAVCQRCPVIDVCREATLRAEGGLSRTSRFGMFAAMTPAQRAELAWQRGYETSQDVPDTINVEGKIA